MHELQRAMNEHAALTRAWKTYERAVRSAYRKRGELPSGQLLMLMRSAFTAGFGAGVTAEQEGDETCDWKENAE